MTSPANAADARADEDGFAPVETVPGDLAGDLLILVDHATNRMPAEYGTLGLAPGELERHIAYDIGAAPLGHALAARFNAPAILTCFSRLLIDPNRGEDDPTLIMRLSDGAVIPGNAGVDSRIREERLARFYRPYHAAIVDMLARMLKGGRAPAILAVHSYTPVWKGTQRPWHAGILWDKDPRFALPLLEGLRADHSLRIGDNEPYLGALRNDTMYRHGTARGIAHALLEVRNDLIAEPAGVLEWTDRLEAVLRVILADEAMHRFQHFGSHADEPDEGSGGSAP
jgi:predicted N-formylglutamate amidohydrolase